MPRSPSENACSDISQPPVQRNGPCAVTLQSHQRLRIANAITAVLLHAEVIRRNAKFTQSANREIELSSQAIERDARLIWGLFEEMRSTAVDS